MKILVVSPDSAMAAALRSVLEPAGLEIAVVPALKDAAQVCHPSVTRAAILFHPSIDAHAIRGIRDAIARGYATVYLCAANWGAEWEERAYLAGASFIFGQPLRASLLHAILCQVPGGTNGSSTKESLAPFAAAAPDSAPLPVARPPTAPLLNRFHEFSGLLKNTHAPERMVTAFLDRVRETLALNRLALYVALPARESLLSCQYAAGLAPEVWKNVALNSESGLGAWMKTHCLALTNASLDRLGVAPQVRQEFHLLGAQLALPMHDNERFFGVLLAGSRITGAPLSSDEIETLYLLLGELAHALRDGHQHQQLNRERDFLSALLDGLGAGCLVVDTKLDVLRVNRVMTDLFGDATGAKDFSFQSLPSDVASRLFQVVRGRSREAEFHFQDAHGRTFHLRAFPFDGAAGVFVLTAEDITALHRQHRLELMTRERELLVRMGSQFVHDVRNSLSRLSTFGQLFAKSRDDSAFLDQLQDALPRDLGRVLRHADLLHLLVNEPRMDRTTVPVRALLQSSWQKVRAEVPAAPAAGLDASRVPESLGVCADPKLLGTIFFELLLNAAQALEDQPPATGAWIKVSAVEDKEGGVRFDFHDYGPGFAADVANIAMEPFVTTKNRGLGLGLTVAKKLAADLSGDLRLRQAQPSEGAVVELHLPFGGPPDSA